jgi:hypothetical protein
MISSFCEMDRNETEGSTAFLANFTGAHSGLNLTPSNWQLATGLWHRELVSLDKAHGRQLANH